MGWVFKIDKNNKAESPEIKVMGFFCFEAGYTITNFIVGVQVKPRPCQNYLEIERYWLSLFH